MEGHTTPIGQHKNIQMTAWLSTLKLSFSITLRSNIVPKSVQMTWVCEGLDIVRSSFSIWFRHLYSPRCWIQVTSCFIILSIASLPGTMVLEKSSWVFACSFFLKHCLTICFHSSNYISVKSFIYLEKHLFLDTNYVQFGLNLLARYSKTLVSVS